MDTASYHIFGLGSGSDDLHYIGWSQKSPEGEQNEIYSELANSTREIAGWVMQAVAAGRIDIFEIETAASAEDAREAVLFRRDYYRWLGLDVTTDR